MIKEIFFRSERMKDDLVDVIFFSPHPDDAEICCGGTISKLASVGHKVCVVDLSRGEMGSRGDIEIRKLESISSSDELGIDLRLNMSFPDSEIGVSDRNAQVKALVKLIRESKPKTVFCPFGDHRNPDHFNSQGIIEEALFYSNLLKKFPDVGGPHLVLHVSYYMMRQTFVPSYVTDISQFIDQKRLSIRAHKSQVGLEGSGHDTLVSNPLALSSIEARDAFYGAMIGTEYGEPFFVKAPISINDPHQYFSSLERGSKTFFFDR